MKEAFVFLAGVVAGWALCRQWWNDTIEAADRQSEELEAMYHQLID